MSEEVSTQETSVVKVRRDEFADRMKAEALTFGSNAVDILGESPTFKQVLLHFSKQGGYRDEAARAYLRGRSDKEWTNGNLKENPEDTDENLAEQVASLASLTEKEINENF